MKLTTLLLIIALAQVSAKGYSQKINLNEKNVPVEKIFQSIEKQTGYVFFYDNNFVKKLMMSVQVKDASIDQILDISFKD
ncbi:hypothetical protein, partial [Pedobacter sp. HMWF019]|uniref:hypothetical protein n=1 Tax=Pedobacter sp. HMWF019 TaxID=2056856 RepID=UPI0011B1FF88